MIKKLKTIRLTEHELSQILWVSTFQCCPICGNGVDMSAWMPFQLAIHTLEHLRLSK